MKNICLVLIAAILSIIQSKAGTNIAGKGWSAKNIMLLPSHSHGILEI